jgi:site-specific DNA recombinase
MPAMIRVALYARYSSDSQSAASIEDQFRICREHALREHWNVIGTYQDAAISGASVVLRPGIRPLLQDAQSGKFDIVLAEALDRVSRDQADTATLFRDLRFASVPIVTLAEGEISELHVGLKGTMNALFLKDLAAKTHRGLRGRVETGKSGGGLCYGYDVTKRADGNGEPIRGERRINEVEAAVIRRIFRDYAAGSSPRTIVYALNAEAIPGPFGRAWGQSTIHGSVKRRNGILNNELYVGKLVWNRQRFLKDPSTGKRVSRLNPESKWIIQEIPELRIIPDDLWQAVKARQESLTLKAADRADNPMLDRRRPRYLFSGLTSCGCCGGGYTMISTASLGCATARNKGTCSNFVTMRRDVLEASVLDGLHRHLMEPELFKDFCDAFTREVNRLRMESGADISARREELPRIDRELAKLLAAIKAGGPIQAIVDDMKRLEARKAELVGLLAEAEEPAPLLHPNMAEIYRRKVSDLATALGNMETRLEAAELIRTLVERVILTPEDGQLGIQLRGALAGILAIATAQKAGQNGQKPGSPSGVGFISPTVQVSLVAGARFERAAFRL